MQLAAFLYVVKLPLGNCSSKTVCEETACQNTANPSEKHILLNPPLASWEQREGHIWSPPGSGYPEAEVSKLGPTCLGTS